MNERLVELQAWLRRELGWAPPSLEPASSDASFRRYFRVSDGGRSHIVMDAPPGKEDSRPFVTVARAMAGLGLNVPQILAADLERGFLLLSDLGTRHYLQALNPSTADRLYGDALRALGRLQAAPVEGAGLPDYDRALLLREMALFRDWYVGRHLGINVGEGLDELLGHSFSLLADAALAQPRVWVHRDYHSRNLLVTQDHNPGILDFQDAVIGPVSYDLVSLLRDCYINWPPERVVQWVQGYLAAQRAEGRLGDVGADQFMRWFDFMGMQRHLKAVGIFARLNYRDAKPGYLADIPRTLGYVIEVSGRYTELHPLHRWLKEQVLPQVR